MNAMELIAKATAAGITLIPEPDGRLTAEGPLPAISELWPEIRQHKADVLALLPANDAPDVVGLVAYGGLLSADPEVARPHGRDGLPLPATIIGAAYRHPRIHLEKPSDDGRIQFVLTQF